MTDREFILFLVKLFWDLVGDGDMPSDSEWDKIKEELLSRDIDPDEVMGY